MGGLCGKEKVVVKRDPQDSGKEKPKLLRFKVCLVGTYDAGKSSVVVRLTKGTFTEGEVLTDGRAVRRQCAALGSHSLQETKRMMVDTQEVELSLHDTAGQEHYQNVTAGFYDQADALVFVYSIASQESYNDLPDWLKEATEASARGKTKPLCLMLANKFDLASQRKVPIAHAEKFAKQSNARYFEVSAKTGDGIDRAFQDLAEQLVKQRDS